MSSIASSSSEPQSPASPVEAPPAWGRWQRRDLWWLVLPVFAGVAGPWCSFSPSDTLRAIGFGLLLLNMAVFLFGAFFLVTLPFYVLAIPFRTFRRERCVIALKMILFLLLSVGTIPLGKPIAKQCRSDYRETIVATHSALKAYKTANGKDAPSLDALVPQYLPAVPQIHEHWAQTYQFYIREDKSWSLRGHRIRWRRDFLFHPLEFLLQNYPNSSKGWVEDDSDIFPR